MVKRSGVLLSLLGMKAERSGREIVGNVVVIVKVSPATFVCVIWVRKMIYVPTNVLHLNG